MLTPKKRRKRQLLEEEKVTHHEGLGVLDILPVSPQVIFTHGSARDIFEKSFTYFIRGLARTHATYAFRMDQSLPEALGRRDERLSKRTVAFNYFYNDAYASVRAMGGGA